MLKAYAIGIVWRCYKYFTMRQHNIRSMLPNIIPEISARQDTLLPDYEEAIAQNMKQQPPPPYYQLTTGTQMITNIINERQFIQSTTSENRGRDHCEVPPTVPGTESNANEVSVPSQMQIQFQQSPNN